MNKDEWEIKFKLQAAQRSESFQFSVNSLRDSSVEFPSFPKDKFLRALQTHSESKHYSLYSGMLRDLKFKRTSDLHENVEIHVIILVFEKIGPISLIFSNKFENLVLEGLDANYNYLGTDALINILIQIIKPDSPTVKGLGNILTIYHASNMEELVKKEKYVPFLDRIEGQSIIFSLSIIIPILFILIIPSQFLDSMLSYVITLGIFSILVCLYPLIKRSIRFAPLSLISALISYLSIETMIHFRVFQGLNPWGIFNNISRQNLIGILRNQDLVKSTGQGVILGFDLLQLLIPFLDAIIIIFIPFTIGVSLTGIFQISERKWKSTMLLRTLFSALLLIFIIIIPLGYHAIGKGTEGTLYASIGLVETAEIFSPEYLNNLDLTYEDLLSLIASTKQHLKLASNSFRQFGNNPLIALILPYIIPNVAGIPLKDLPNILTLTNVLAEAVPHFYPLSWAYFNLQLGFNQSFLILIQTMEKITEGGLGAQISPKYNSSMKDALSILQLGVNNLTDAQQPLLSLVRTVQQTLNYSIFADISNVLTELEIGLPILVNTTNEVVPWINSTYKLTLVLDDLSEYNFESQLLEEAEKDFNASKGLYDIDIGSFPDIEDPLIPIQDLVNFIINLHQVTKHMMFSVRNATHMFRSLNKTMKLMDDINFSDVSNIYDPIWSNIDLGLHNTSSYLAATQTSLNNMSDVITSQEPLEFAGLNKLLDEFEEFTNSTSERFDLVESYVLALNETSNAVKFFSMGTNSLNAALNAPVFNSTDYDTAINNFTMCQESANTTDEILSGISNHLLNETAITNWRNLVKGNITNIATNSIYMNAEGCLVLIDEIINFGSVTIPDDLTEFTAILSDMEQLDWNIFTL
ncbi:MAG: hypothetical protein ACFFAJ_00505 [Candidatus Hodarchaeota archaeon]